MTVRIVMRRRGQEPTMRASTMLASCTSAAIIRGRRHDACTRAHSAVEALGPLVRHAKNGDVVACADARHSAVRIGTVAWIVVLSVLAMLALAVLQPAAAAGVPVMSVTTTAEGAQEYSLTLQLLILMSALTLLPGMVLMMTAFTRIVIVLAILRQALGAGQAPPNQVLIGLALFLTLFVMGPVLDRINTQAVQPYLAGTLEASRALPEAIGPLREFMLAQTRENDIATFARIAGEGAFERPEDVPLRILVPAFATSELKSAFQIGFLLFIPFVIIDLVVASVLMSMGMMMLSPVLISLPFKLMLFVLVDGWALIMGTLAASFYR